MSKPLSETKIDRPVSLRAVAAGIAAMTLASGVVTLCAIILLSSSDVRASMAEAEPRATYSLAGVRPSMTHGVIVTYKIHSGDQLSYVYWYGVPFRSMQVSM